MYVWEDKAGKDQTRRTRAWMEGHLIPASEKHAFLASLLEGATVRYPGWRDYLGTVHAGLYHYTNALLTFKILFLFVR
jgi:hypothetical protein